MSSVAAPICVACGNEMGHLARSGYGRCHDCVATDRPHSLVLARRARAARWRETHELGDFDPVGSAAAA